MNSETTRVVLQQPRTSQERPQEPSQERPQEPSQESHASERGWCSSMCVSLTERERFEAVMTTIQLTPLQRELIESRYLYVLENFRRRARKYSMMFYLGHFIITVGSLFVPALLSIQNSDLTIQVYWLTFTVSLMVTMCNGILTLFKIDKKYYFLHTTLERLRSEGWQYFGLTGRYAGHLIGPGFEPTHANQFMFFSHYVEKIKMSQVEEEYDKTDDNPAAQQVHASSATSTTKPDVHLPSLTKVPRLRFPPPPLPTTRFPTKPVSGPSVQAQVPSVQAQVPSVQAQVPSVQAQVPSVSSAAVVLDVPDSLQYLHRVTATTSTEEKISSPEE